MEKKSVGLIILLWSEIILSLRILLFTVPVMINRYSAGHLSVSNLEDQFIGLMSLTAGLYFFIGILSLAGNKLWKSAHLLAVVLILSFTLASARISGWTLGQQNAHFALPLLFSVIVNVFAGILGKAKKTA